MLSTCMVNAPRQSLSSWLLLMSVSVACGRELPHALNERGPMEHDAHRASRRGEGQYSVRLRDHGISASAAGIAAFLGSLQVDRWGAARLDQLLEELGSADFARRQAATRAISNLPNPPLRRLRELAEQTEDTEVRFRVQRILENIDRGLADSVLVACFRVIHERRIPGMLPLILPLIASWNHPTLLEAAGQAAIATCTEHDLPQLSALLLAERKSLGVRIVALDAILHLKGDEGLASARALLSDSADAVRYEVALRFGDRGRAEAIPALIGLLESNQAGLSERAHRGLCALLGQSVTLNMDPPPNAAQIASWWKQFRQRHPSVPPQHYPVHQAILLHDVLEVGGSVRLFGNDNWIRPGAALNPGPLAICEIDLRRCKATDELVSRTMALPQLVSLDLTSCGEITNQAFQEIRRLQSLRRLFLEETRVSDQVVPAIFQLPALEELRLGRLVSDAGLMHVHAGSPVRQLSLSYSQVTDLGLDAVARLGQLRGLRLYRCPGVSDAGLAEVARLRHLNSLTLTCPRVTDAGLRHLVGLRQLEALDLYTTQTSTDGMRHVAKLRALRRLNLSRTKIDDEATRHLTGLQSLQHLNLSYTGISDAALEPLQQLSGLTHLWLESTHVTGTGLVHLLSLDQLRSLQLYNSKLTDEGLKWVGRLSNLTHLDIGNTSVSDDGLRHLSDLTAVIELDISRSPVSNEGLRYLHGFSRLAKLNRRRTKINQTGIAALRQAVPTLVEVR